MEPQKPKIPNVLITGTPGTGKTTLAKAVAEVTGLEHVNVGELVKQHDFIEEKDEEFDTLVPDEDALLDHMEDMMVEGGKIVDYHSSELFPERWFSLVVVLRTSTETLFDRLSARNYSEKKREENMSCEIMGVPLEEATESYDPAIVKEMPNNNIDEQEAIIEALQSWCAANNIPERT